MAEAHWLQPIAERLARAEELATSARDVAKNYETSGKVRIVKEVDGDAVQLHLRVSAPPPPRLALLVGEAVHQLRASLDNLVVILADQSAGSRLSADEARHLQFPIASTAEAFVGSTRQLRGLREDFIDRIEEVQPYHLLSYSHGEAAPIRADQEPLAELRELSNHDKHRRVHLVLHRASGLEVHHDGRTPGPGIHLSRDILNDGDLIARVNNAKPSEVHATVELMLEHPITGRPLRLEAILNRLIWMLSAEVIPHITGHRALIGHAFRDLPSLD